MYHTSDGDYGVVAISETAKHKRENTKTKFQRIRLIFGALRTMHLYFPRFAWVYEPDAWK